MVSWFACVKTWKQELFCEREYKRIAEALGIPLFPEVVEREALFYDTLEAFLSSFREDVVFVGGSMINRVYVREGPRFSFDLDAFWARGSASKRSIAAKLVEVNEELESEGRIAERSVGDGVLRLGEIVVDVEKDVFPGVLSLKRVMPSILAGTPLPVYAKKRLFLDPERPEVAKDILLLKEELGFVPKVEEIRIEVGYSGYGYEGKKTLKELPSLLEPHEKPLKRARGFCASRSECIWRKMKELEVFDEFKIHDQVRALCDLRMLLKARKREMDYAFSKVDIRGVLKTIEKLRRAGGEIYEESWHFYFASRQIPWSRLVRLVEEKIRTHVR